MDGQESWWKRLRESMGDQLHSMSLKRRLLFYLVLLLGLSYLGTALLLNISITGQMETLYTGFARQNINQAMLDLEGRVGNVDRVMQVLLADPSVREYLQAPSDQTAPAVRMLFGTIREQYPEMLGIALIDGKDALLSNEMYRPEIRAAVQSPWRTDLIEGTSKLQFIRRPYGRNLAYFRPISPDRILSVVRPVMGPDRTVQGILLVDMDVDFLKNRLEAFKPGKDGFVCILTPEGAMAYAPENPTVPRLKSQWFSSSEKGVLTRSIRGKPYQMIYDTSRYTGFKVVGLFPENETLKAVSEFRTYFLGIILLVMAISIPGAQRISDTVVQPLEKLKELMSRAEKGDLTVSFNPQYLDEIGQLGLRFDRMIREISNLIGLVKEEQTRKRQAELRVLQSQINPHFLYNTFDTIHWMLKKYQAEDVIDVIRKLTDLFRISLNGGRDSLLLSQEIRHVEAYLSIQKVRYESLLEYQIEVPEEMMNYQVNKLILQPLVENAIYHGVKNREEGGLITLSGRIESEALLLEVHDNGPGLSQEQLNQLKQKMDTPDLLSAAPNGKGVGLLNVHQRIQLAHGTQYGVSLASEEGEWIRVSLRLPKIFGEEGSDV